MIKFKRKIRRISKKSFGITVPKVFIENGMLKPDIEYIIEIKGGDENEK